MIFFIYRHSIFCDRLTDNAIHIRQVNYDSGQVQFRRPLLQG